MWPDRVSNLGPLTYESGALPAALCGPARSNSIIFICLLYRAQLLKEFAPIGANSVRVEPHLVELSHYELSHLYLCCLQIQTIFAL